MISYQKFRYSEQNANFIDAAPYFSRFCTILNSMRQRASKQRAQIKKSECFTLDTGWQQRDFFCDRAERSYFHSFPLVFTHSRFPVLFRSFPLALFMRQNAFEKRHKMRVCVCVQRNKIKQLWKSNDDKIIKVIKYREKIFL